MLENANSLPGGPQQLRILAFGNSLTEGYCEYGTKFHPYSIALEARLRELLPDLTITVDVNGRSGDCVMTSLPGVYQNRLREALTAKSSGQSYDFVIMLGGTNDLAYTFGDPEGPIKIFEALEKCYNQVLDSGSSLVCLTVPERSLDKQNTDVGRQGRSARLELNALIEKFVEEHQGISGTGKRVFVMDFATKVPFELAETKDGRSTSDKGLWSVDGLHMEAEGYDHVGSLLADFLVDLLKNE